MSSCYCCGKTPSNSCTMVDYVGEFVEQKKGDTERVRLCERCDLKIRGTIWSLIERKRIERIEKGKAGGPVNADSAAG